MRKQNHEQADKRALKEYSDYGHEDPYLYGYPSGAMSASKPTFSTTPSLQSSLQSNPRRRSASSTSSTYGYTLPHMPSHIRKPRPIVVSSAIEKSDFRTHLDGMSSSLRGKLGGLIKGKKDVIEKPRPRPVTSAMNMDISSRSENYTPSLDAVPSLTSSTSPSEGQATFSSSGYLTPASRHRQQQESVIHKIRRFEGGGKLPQLGWKSLSNVSIAKARLVDLALMLVRTLSCGTRRGTFLFTCTCKVHGQSLPLPSALILESSSNLGPRPSLISCTMCRNRKAGLSFIQMTRGL